MLGASQEPRDSVVRPLPRDLPTFLPYASGQLQAPFRVRVLIVKQEEYVSKADDKSSRASSKSKTAAMQQQPSRMFTSSQERSQESSATAAVGALEPGDEVLVSAVHDTSEHLVELTFGRCKEVPRLLMQLVALCVPYQSLLSRLTVRCRSSLAGEVLYEIAKFVPLSQLTDVCLDDSPVPERNYGALLACEQLRRLSLERCELDDEDCVAIAELLPHPLPASRHLHTLSLAGNAIADAGAAALGVALRSNRALHHLNLAGNRLSDDAARALFRPLAEFPLSYEELTAKRRRCVDFLHLRKQMFQRCLAELTASWLDRQADECRASAKRRTLTSSARVRNVSVSSGSGIYGADGLTMRAEAMVNELVGAFNDPFGLEETISKEEYVYSLGNTSLCYVNLSHNHLGYGTVTLVLTVLRYQAELVRKAGPGLLRVQLEGNPMPETCGEYADIENLLNRAILWKVAKPLKKSDKSKSKIK